MIIFEKEKDYFDPNISDLLNLELNHVAVNLMRNLHAADYSKDVSFNIEEHSVRVHSCVLQASSVVFRNMPFASITWSDTEDNGFCIASSECSQVPITLKGVTLQGVQAFVSFLYELLDKRTLLKFKEELILFAGLYDYPNLMEACLQAFTLVMTTNKVFDFLVFAMEYRVHDLKKLCFDYLAVEGIVFHVSRLTESFEQCSLGLKKELLLLFEEKRKVLEMLGVIDKDMLALSFSR